MQPVSVPIAAFLQNIHTNKLHNTPPSPHSLINISSYIPMKKDNKNLLTISSYMHMARASLIGSSAALAIGQISIRF